MRRKPILKSIYKNDPQRKIEQNKYSTGKVSGFAGGQVTVDVGANLPDGTPVQIKVPVADGFTPAVGQTVQIQYPNGLHSGYAGMVGKSSTVSSGTVLADGEVTPAKLSNPNALFCIGLHVATIGASALASTKQVAVKNKSGKALTIVGVSIFARTISGASNPTVDLYEGTSSVLSGAQSVSAAETIYEPTVTDTALANGAELSLRCTTASDGSIGELDVAVWCKAEHAT